MVEKTLPKYRVKLAYHGWSVGAIIEPVGLWRDELLAKGWIELVQETPKPLEQHVIRRRNKPLINSSQESAVG